MSALHRCIAAIPSEMSKLTYQRSTFLMPAILDHGLEWRRRTRCLCTYEGRMDFDLDGIAARTSANDSVESLVIVSMSIASTYEEEWGARIAGLGIPDTAIA